MIVDAVLGHLQEVLRDLRTEAERRGPELGVAPTSFVVEQRTPTAHAAFNTGTTLRRWHVTLTDYVETPIEEEVVSPVRSGMYYDRGRADFVLYEHAAKVRIGWQVGPMYGRGYDLPIERSAEGSIHFGKAVRLWVS